MGQIEVSAHRDSRIPYLAFFAQERARSGPCAGSYGSSKTLRLPLVMK